MKFNTARLSVENWERVLADPRKRLVLERELESILTPKITWYLPLSMQFSTGRDSISKWVDERADEAQMLCVHSMETQCLVGLIILFKDVESSALRTIRLGYFLGEADWGNGYATELVKALIANLDDGNGFRVLAAVDSDNIGSARVLEKSGFQKSHEQSTDSRFFFELVIA